MIAIPFGVIRINTYFYNNSYYSNGYTIGGNESLSSFQLVLSCTGYTYRVNPYYKWDNVNFNITIQCDKGVFTCTSPGQIGGGDENNNAGVYVYITSVSLKSFTKL